MGNDITILGGGPGGYVAAIRAAQLGAKVTLIEQKTLGGTCLNKGCIPTKALYRSAEILNTLKNIDEFGIKVDSYSINVEQMQERKQSVVDKLVGGVSQLLTANHVEVIDGRGTLIDRNTVAVTLKDGSRVEIKTNNIIIATGSETLVPPIPGADMEGVYTSDDILNFREVPKSLTIIGGGVIGMEFAGIFNALGCEVSVVEFLPNILAQVDSDLTKRLTLSLKKKGINIYTSTKVTRIDKKHDGFFVKAEGKKGELVLNSEKVLIAVGRKPVTEGINLEGLGIEFDKKGIKVDENLQTNVKGIFAIGDVNGRIMLAHAASHQGIYAVEKIMGHSHKNLSEAVPNCIFIFPEIAAVGLMEEEAKSKGIEYKVSKFMFGANGKALALGEAEGMVKVIASKDNKIIGIHIMGPHASDLIHEGVLAMNVNLDIDTVINTIHGHPTLSEAFAEAVMGIDGQAIHAVPARR